MTAFDRMMSRYGLNTKKETAEEILNRYRQRQERFARMNYFYQTGQLTKAREMRTAMLNAVSFNPAQQKL